MKYTKKLAYVPLLTIVLLLQSCGVFFNQPLQKQKSRAGEFTTSTKPLRELPEAKNPVEVAVYNFRDQTGQYKAVDNGSTFSTAITQGGTSILLKALEDSGWFIPIERENLSNLSTERNIIRKTKEEYVKNLNPNEPPLPPLKYAGIILEGGVVSYDTNIITGGAGARYFGLGGSVKYRQDRISIYLRMVSTSNGQILKTVYVSKTILSQALDANFFRFVKFQRLLEAEMGITQNEPVQLAIQDALEKAVRSLIIEGVEGGYWSAKGGAAVNDTLVAEYRKEKALEESTALYEREFFEPLHKNSLSLDVGTTLLDADYTKKDFGPLVRLGYTHNLNSAFGLNLNAGVFQFRTGNSIEEMFGNVDLNLRLRLLPNDAFSPFIYAGGGVIFKLDKVADTSPASAETSGKFQYGGGIEYALSPRWGLQLWGEHNLSFNDRLDGLVNGKRDDFFINIGLGLNYNFGFGKKENDLPEETINTNMQ